MCVCHCVCERDRTRTREGSKNPSKFKNCTFFFLSLFAQNPKSRIFTSAYASLKYQWRGSAKGIIHFWTKIFELENSPSCRIWFCRKDVSRRCPGHLCSSPIVYHPKSEDMHGQCPVRVRPCISCPRRGGGGNERCNALPWSAAQEKCHGEKCTVESEKAQKEETNVVNAKTAAM